jgi:hypothetical protein
LHNLPPGNAIEDKKNKPKTTADNPQHFHRACRSPDADGLKQHVHPGTGSQTRTFICPLSVESYILLKQLQPFSV